ncbi:SpaA isopeptide-forming pilin-related protein [Neoactinobaculum massilliense]|uniref:SpaA isopeptide-forming pilin-related protein n=1 Tax=Neoactinobaculum massilliense TaxID=2364794 RepID=UPI0013DDBAC6|nr:SpaA isopeptide-forming pilin-related protein [Neoactinobaculum massilliense]
MKRLIHARTVTALVFVFVLCGALIAGVAPLSASTADPVTSSQGAQVSAAAAQLSNSTSNGTVKLTISASTTSLPAGGGDVTYTYTVTNLATHSIFLDGFSDNRCAPVDIKDAGDLSVGSGMLAAGGTVTYTCTSRVTVTTTSTATLRYSDYHATNIHGQVQAAVTVSIGSTSGAASCNTLWFGSGQRANGDFGRVGTIDPTTYAATSKYTIDRLVDPTPGTNETMTTTGTAALAVDPLDPTQVYFAPRYVYQDGSYDMGGLHAYNSVTNTVSDQLTLWRDTPFTVRMGVDAEGTEWIVDNQGAIWRHARGGTNWTGGAVLSTSNGYTFAPNQAMTLASGDLAFDGLGNMWIIGSRQSDGTAFLYTVSKESLASDEPKAQLVGSMGKGEFNGIAFMEDGTLWASTRDVDKNGNVTGGSKLWQVNKVTGKATQKAAYSNFQIEDLGSCALPKPELAVEKTAALGDGVVTYTVTISNLGQLEATGVQLVDDLAAQGITYIPGSTKMNGQTVPDGAGGQFPFASAADVHSPDTGFSGLVTTGTSGVLTVTFDTKPFAGQTHVCNQATATFVGALAVVKSDDPAVQGGADPTCYDVKNPQIGINKYAKNNQVVADGSPITYFYQVSTDPNQPKGMEPYDAASDTYGAYPSPAKEVGAEPLKNVTVTDDKCSNVQSVTDTTGYNVGDRNEDGLLQPSEVWLYRCTTDAGVSEDVTNTATANGVGYFSGTPVTDADTWTVHPAQFAVQKLAQAGSGWNETGSAIEVTNGANGPQLVATYQVTVTNTGQVSAPHPSVTDTVAVPDGLTVADISVNNAAVQIAQSGQAATFTIPASAQSLTPGATTTYTVSVTYRVTTPASTDWNKLAECTPGRGLHNSVTLDGDTDGTANNEACVPVTPPSLSFQVAKLGTNCDTNQPTCALPGAAFALYDADPSTGASPIASELTADSTGAVFTAAGLTPGTYWVVETRAPAGHNLLATPVQVTLDFSGVHTEAQETAYVTLTQPYTLEIVDQTPMALPQAGGDGGYGRWAWLGAALMALGAGLMMRNFRSER